MDWKKHIAESIYDVRICESVGITIEAIEDRGLYRLVYKDPHCNLFKKQYLESDKYFLKAQIGFNLMIAYRKTADLIFKKLYY